VSRFSADTRKAIAALALDSPHLFNARYHWEREDVRALKTMVSYINAIGSDVTADELVAIMAEEKAAREA
jgi:hypothetical protein